MSDKESKNEEKKPIVIKNATDLQRLKLEKLMKNPVFIVSNILCNFLYSFGHLVQIKFVCFFEG